MTTPSWHIITGEYSPARGGVADYSRSVACGLARAGDEVHVWAPPADRPLSEDHGVIVHTLSLGFGPRGIQALSQALRAHRKPHRLLVQYTPQAFGMKALNLPFCAWLAARRDVEVWVMFHEAVIPWDPQWRWRRTIAAAGTRAMAAMLLARADRTLLSVPAWEGYLRPLSVSWQGATWSPIPSSLPTEVTSDARAAARAPLKVAEGDTVIGHFGTYGALIAPLLRPALLELLKGQPRRFALLVGRGSDDAARDLQSDPSLSGRISGTGAMEPRDIAAHVAACDLLVQPYPDGVTTRRTSAMAGLALGVPIATNDGALTEPLWRESGAVALAGTPYFLATAAEAVLQDRGKLAQLGALGRRLYDERFSIRHTIRVLREPRVERERARTA